MPCQFIRVNCSLTAVKFIPSRICWGFITKQTILFCFLEIPGPTNWVNVKLNFKANADAGLLSLALIRVFLIFFISNLLKPKHTVLNAYRVRFEISLFFCAAFGPCLLVFTVYGFSFNLFSEIVIHNRSLLAAAVWVLLFLFPTVSENAQMPRWYLCLLPPVFAIRFPLMNAMLHGPLLCWHLWMK